MGTLRARSDKEIDSRKAEILNVTEKLFLTTEYQDITLAIIAEKTSISRPSMYNYYKTKEEVFLDLSKREYLRFEETIRHSFTKKLSKKQFCKKMSDVLWEHQTFLKLLSLHTSIIEDKCGIELMHNFKKAVMPMYTTFSNILEKQFPQSTSEQRDLFKAHFFMYAYSVYPASHIPDAQIKIMNELKPFGNLPAPKQLLLNALELLSSNL